MSLWRQRGACLGDVSIRRLLLFRPYRKPPRPKLIGEMLDLAPSFTKPPTKVREGRMPERRLKSGIGQRLYQRSIEARNGNPVGVLEPRAKLAQRRVLWCEDGNLRSRPIELGHVSFFDGVMPPSPDRGPRSVRVDCANMLAGRSRLRAGGRGRGLPSRAPDFVLEVGNYRSAAPYGVGLLSGAQTHPFLSRAAEGMTHVGWNVHDGVKRAAFAPSCDAPHETHY